jgi:hypothetical protein
MPDIIHKDFTVEIPKNFVSLVTVGDRVVKGQVLVKETEKDEVINISQHLSIPLSKVKNVLKKNPGDPVKVGDVIAVKKSFLGHEEAVISKVEGIVSRYERSTGNLLIRTSLRAPTENVISPVAGIISMCDNEQIIISASTSESNSAEANPSASSGLSTAEEDREGEEPPLRQGFAGQAEEPAAFTESYGEPKEEESEVEQEQAGDKIGIGEVGEGELFVLEESFSGDDSENVLYDLDSKATGKIVLGGVLTRDILMKGIGIGVTGFLGSKIRKGDLDFFVHKQTKTPIIQIDEDTAGRLRHWKGRKMVVKGEERSISFVL